MVTIVKVGGAIIEDVHALSELLLQLTNIKGDKILVHGGGRNSSNLMLKLGLTPQMIEGRRVTDAATLEVVTLSYTSINKKIVAQLQAKNVSTIGLCGADGNLLLAKKRPPNPIDFGFVGDVKKSNVNTKLLQGLFDLQLLPVIAPLTYDGSGSLLNTNADTMASVIAQALQKIDEVRLLYVFEKLGLLKNVDDDDSLITEFSVNDYEASKELDYIHSGMHPKLKNAFDAISNGVGEVYLCNVENMVSLKKSTKILP